MRKVLASFVAALALPALAVAGEVEINGFAGYTFPFYSQTFAYDPGPVTVGLPGVSIQQGGAFELRGSGGPAFGGSLTLYLVDPLGIEARIDSADITVQTDSPTYDVRVSLPSPLPPVATTLSLPEGEADLKSATPFSLNVRLRSPGATRVFVSGGLSYLRDLSFSMRQQIGLGVSLVNEETSSVNVATITMRARRRPGDPRRNWGINGGVGFQIPLGERGGLVVEGRGFYFPSQDLEWEAIIETPLGAFETQLLGRVQERLDAVEFQPWLVQATIGVAYRF